MKYYLFEKSNMDLINISKQRIIIVINHCKNAELKEEKKEFDYIVNKDEEFLENHPRLVIKLMQTKRKYLSNAYESKKIKIN